MFGLLWPTVPVQLFTHYRPSSLFLVTGKQSFKSCGAEEELKDALRELGKRLARSSGLLHIRATERNNGKVTVFSDFEVDPKLDDVARGIDTFRENNCDLVLAVGESHCPKTWVDAHGLLRGRRWVGARYSQAGVCVRCAGHEP